MIIGMNIFLLLLISTLQSSAFDKLDTNSESEIILHESSGSANATSFNYEHSPDAAFGDGPSFWQSDVIQKLPQSIWWKFRHPIIVGRYSLNSRNDGRYELTDGPSKFLFWGSDGPSCDDEKKWVILVDNFNYQFNQMQFVHSNKPYLCYGFKVQGIRGRRSNQHWVTISGIHFYHHYLRISDNATSSEDLLKVESQICSETYRCKFSEGTCMSKSRTCQGAIVEAACEEGCICCSQKEQLSASRPAGQYGLILANSPRSSEESSLKYIAELELSDIWEHLVNQFLHPFEDGWFPRGKHFVYILDTENPANKTNTISITIPTIDAIDTLLADVGHTQRGAENMPSFFSTDTREAISKLEDLYSRAGTASDILTLAVNIRDHVNEYVHLAALRQVLLFEQDMSGFILPPLFESFPEWFLKHPPKDDRECDSCHIDIEDFSEESMLNNTEKCTFQKPYTDDLVSNEWKVSYWREDRDLNAFLGDWHHYNSQRRGGPRWDDPAYRHGELHYYFYSQMLARYDQERLSNNLPQLRSLSNWESDDHIRENYIADLIYPTLDRSAQKSAQILKKIKRYRKNIEEDIDHQYLINSTCQHNEIGTDKGIRILGCVLEHDLHGCGDTFNEQYSDLSNRGHIILAKLGCEYEEQNRSLMGVLAVPWAAPRDPLFYRWHKFIDGLFRRHKNTLQHYTEHQLALPEVVISDVSIQSEGTDSENELQTFNSYRKIDFNHMKGESGCVYQPHINSHPYNYSIMMNNKGKKRVSVRLRIYLAPVWDLDNFTMSFEEQRTLWVLMDNFKIDLKGQTTRKITRSSCDSTVTVKPPLSSDDIKNMFRHNFDTSKEEEEGYKYREPRDFLKRHPIIRMCGLPNHLLLPKGWSEGMPFQFFFYATRFPSKTEPDDCYDLESSDLCGTEYLHCSSYNDEPKGFPFDRPLNKIGCNHIDFTKDLDKLLSNVKVHDVKILYSDIIHNDAKCV